MRTSPHLAPETVARARAFRKNPTEAEVQLWAALRKAFPEARFRRQLPFGKYFADFTSHRAKLIIEVDGGQHVERMEYDAQRTRFLESEGYRVIRFWNNDVLGNIEGVLESILNELPSPLVGEGAPQGRMRGARRSRAPA